MSLNKCPSCRGVLEDDGTCSCGFGMREKVKKTRSSDEVKNVRTKCHFNEFGRLCERPGTISPSTHGGGPWYCRKHAHVAFHDGEDHPEPPPDRESMEEVDKRVHAIVPRLPGESEHDWSMRCRAYVMKMVKQLAAKMMSNTPNRDWAHRILARQASGENMTFQSIEMANEALRNRHTRQPGED